MVANAVFPLIGEVGVRGSEQVAKRVVVGSMLVFVSNDETYRTARRFPLENATQQFHAVAFVAARRNSTLPRTTTVQLGLNEVQIDFHTRRHPIDNAANGIAVALAERRQSENMSESVAHRLKILFSAASTAAIFVVAIATAATATSTTRQLTDDLLDFGLGSLVAMNHSTSEIQRFACERMVQIDHDHIAANLENAPKEAVARAILQGNDGINVDVLAIELPIDDKHFAVEFQHALLQICAVGLLGRQREIEGVAAFQGLQLLFESLERNTAATDELERCFRRRTLDEVASVFLEGKQVVGHAKLFFYVLFHCFF